MRPLLPLIVLGSASAASAQSWEFTFSNPTLSPENPSTTITLWATFAPEDWAFGLGVLDVLASEPGWSHPATLIFHPGQQAGEVRPDGRVAGIRVSQSNLGGFEPSPQNPIPTWEATFTVTDFSPREIILATETSRFEVYLSSSHLLPEPRTPIDVEVPFQVIPAPAPLALLALSALAACTRRPRSTP